MNRNLIRIVVCLCAWPALVSAKKRPDERTVEIKCLIPTDKVVPFYKKLHLGSKLPLTRVVCFFDTENLSLFRHQPTVVLRSRYGSTDDTETTVKIRDGEVRGKGVQCEFDEVVGREKIMSCSVTDESQEKAQIRRANAGRGIKKIFSKQQEATIESAFGRIDWKTFRPYGPVKRIQVWKKIHVAGRPNLTVERWTLPARANRPARMIFEVSAKVPLSEEPETSKWIAELAGHPDSGSDQESETKTRIVLEHFKSNVP